MRNYKIRIVDFDELPAINEIYNQAVKHKYQTADMVAITGEHYQKLQK